MDLFPSRKVRRYLQGIERTARSAVQEQPRNSPESAFYLGIVSAARQRLGTEPVPTNRQAWLDSVLPSLAYGWVFAAEQIARSTERWDPTFHFVMPGPSETRLYETGRVRTSRTLWYDSVDDLDLGLRLLERDPPSSGPRDEVMRRLGSARAGFAHLWPRLHWRESTFGRSLSAQCHQVILSITAGDRSRLQHEREDAISLLARARRFSPTWSWSIDNER